MSLKTLIHRSVWQRLPRRFRRALLQRATMLLAPRAPARPPGGGPIVVVGPFHTASGLGESARLCHRALAATGFDVMGIDVTDVLMQPRDHPDFAFADAAKTRGPGTLVVHVNAPVLPLVMARLGRGLVARKRIVGYWAWELPAVPAEWRFGLPFVHEVWAPSAFTAEAIARMPGAPPVRVVPHPIGVANEDRAMPPARAEGAPFTVLTLFNMASSFARKNPVAVVEAFRLAFGDDPSVRLIVKMSNPDAYREGAARLRDAAAGARNIVLREAILSAEGLDALYASADVVVSLHRSEGFGLIVAEAMMRGLPVIATDWSGSVDFFGARHGIPVGFALIPASDPQGVYDHAEMAWADPDVAQAAMALRRLRDAPQEAHRLGRQGRADALSAFGETLYAERVEAALGQGHRRQTPRPAG